MLYESLRVKLTELRKANKPLEKSVLSVVIGDADTLGAKNNTTPTDDQVEKIIRKVIESNQETITALGCKNDEMRLTLTKENEYLSTLLPKTLSVEEISNYLEPVFNEIKIAKADGAATGIASKYLKGLNIKALGGEVAKAVQKIRSQS